MRENDMLIHSTEKNILQITKWNKILGRSIWVLFFILFLIEGIIAICYCTGITLDARFNNWEYIVSYFIRPCSIVLITILVSKGITRMFAARYEANVQSWFILFTLTVIVTEIVAFHHGISVIYVLYVLPIVASLLYVKHIMLFITYLSSIFMYLLVLSYIIAVIPENEYRHNYMDVLGNIAILTSVYTICRMILFRVRELIDTALDETLHRTQLSHEITLDSLTQLYNHATFYKRLDAFIVAFNQDKTRNFSLILMDIDDFKKINDTYGHNTGDQVILRLVETVKDHLGSEDLAFRYGGEEFAILTPEPECAYDLAEAIRAGFAEQCFSDISHNVTISIGISTYNDTFGGKREFFSSSDKALYKAKHSGKNCVCVGE